MEQWLPLLLLLQLVLLVRQAMLLLVLVLHRKAVRVLTAQSGRRYAHRRASETSTFGWLGKYPALRLRRRLGREMMEEVVLLLLLLLLPGGLRLRHVAVVVTNNGEAAERALGGARRRDRRARGRTRGRARGRVGYRGVGRVSTVRRKLADLLQLAPALGRRRQRVQRRVFGLLHRAHVRQALAPVLKVPPARAARVLERSGRARRERSARQRGPRARGRVARRRRGRRRVARPAVCANQVGSLHLESARAAAA